MAPVDLTRLLRPRAIAVYGRAADRVIRECDRLGFAGEIWPVHPHLAEIAGRRCRRSAADLPGSPDAAFIGVNAEATVAIIRELAGREAGGAVAYAAGFRETGAAGASLQDDLIAAAGPLPVLGPNCYGFINYFDGALLWPDLHGGTRVERGVALITQSSNIAINLTMSRRGLPIGYVIALGNQAMVGLPDAIAAVAADARVSAIGLHIEGIADLPAFADAVAVARECGKPVVALKAGRTAGAARATMSHTASLAGAAAVASAAFARIGVAEVSTLPALIESLMLLHAGGPLTGPRLASLSCSGGEAALMSDAVAGSTLSFKEFSDEDVARIRATVDPRVAVANPFDYHTFDWGRRDRLTDTFAAVMLSGVDLTLLVLDWPRPELGPAPDWDAAAGALADAAERTGTRAAVLATFPEGLPEARATRLAARGIAPLAGLTESVEAIAAAAFLGTVTPGPIRPPDRLIEGPVVALSETAAKFELVDFGMIMPEGRVCRSAAQAVAAARMIGGPVVAKAVSTNLLHKSEHGAVILGLTDPTAVKAAFARLARLGDSVLIEAMVTDVVAELIVGVARDPVVGLHLLVGAGGIFAEVLQDTAVLCLPVTADEIRATLMRLRLAPLLTGYRGRPPADLDAAVTAIMAVATYAEAHADDLVELDVNPLMLCRRDAIVADALIRWVVVPDEEEG
jgi:acetate---CoA ligase (ADP-forming)